MSYTLSYSSIARHQATLKSEFGGSSKYSVLNGEIFVRAKPQTKEASTQNFKNKHQEIDLSKAEFNGIDLSESDLLKAANCNSTIEIDDQPPKTYKLNKSKVRKRCHALSRLEKSKKFLAFYTITFPEGLPDTDCYKLFNLWLTRCRRTGGLTTYLWVAERQKNSTIHFHMLTNDFMPIKKVNGYMAKTLSNVKKKGHEKLTDIDAEVYCIRRALCTPLAVIN